MLYRLVLAYSMASSVPPVSKDQALLETFFQCLSRCAHDKAKELLDKEREVLRVQPMSTWGLLVQALTTLAMAEKAYVSLQFLGQNLGQKLFGRKESLKTSYNHLLSELRKIEEGSHSEVAATGENLNGLLGHLCGQLCEYITGRSKLIEFYEQVLSMSQSRNTTYEDLQMVISGIYQDHQKAFHHPILSPLKSHFNLECDVMNQLLQAQLQLQLWQFLPTLLHLQEASTKLSLWANNHLLAKEVKRMGFGTSSKPTLPNHYQWLVKYKASLVSKFSFYFYEVLSRNCQASPTDVKALMSKASTDFYSKVVTFHKKCDAAHVCLVLDVTGMNKLYSRDGYRHPDQITDEPHGLYCYPAIFSYPGEKPECHWPSVVSIMVDRTDQLNSHEKVVHFCDERLLYSYFLTRVEPRITIVIIFNTKKAEKDSYVSNFFMDICPQLRCTKIFTSLKTAR